MNVFVDVSCEMERVHKKIPGSDTHGMQKVNISHQALINAYDSRTGIFLFVSAFDT